MARNSRASGPHPAGLAVFLLCLALSFQGAGCGSGKQPSLAERRAEIENSAVQFLDACGNLDTAAVLSMLSPGYHEANGLGDTLSKDSLQRAAGTFVSYRFDPSSDIVVEEERGLVTVYIDYGTFGTKEETLVLAREGDAYLVDSFTAMHWNTTPPPPPDDDKPQDGVEKSLRAFVEACVRGNTDYIFKSLSDAYKSEHRLARAWTAPEFAGIFGEARSFEFAPAEIEMAGDNRAEVDVTIDFGSRGNLESETSRVSLLREGGTWKMDVFPFFMY